MLNDNTTASVSYIITFFGDMEKINEYIGHYSNVMLELRNKYNNTPLAELPKKLQEDEKNTLLSIVQSSRFWSIRTYVKLCALKTRLKITDKDFKEIEKSFNIIKTEAVPEYQVFEDFTIKVNSIFVEGIASELLKSVQDYWAQMNTGSAGING